MGLHTFTSYKFILTINLYILFFKYISMNLLDYVTEEIADNVFDLRYQDMIFDSIYNLLKDKPYNDIIKLSKQYNCDITDYMNTFSNEELNEYDTKCNIITYFVHEIISNYGSKIANKIVKRIFG